MTSAPQIRSRVIVNLSDGGADSHVFREFDLEQKKFIDDGFSVAQAAKYSKAWLSENEILVAADEGEDSLTESGYPRRVRLWKRGEDISKAIKLLEVPGDHVGVGLASDFIGGKPLCFVYDMISFFESFKYVFVDHKLHQLDLPKTSLMHGVFNGRLLVELKQDGVIAKKEYQAGDLISFDLGKLIEKEKVPKLVFRPTKKMSSVKVNRLKDYLMLTVHVDVKSTVIRISIDSQGVPRQEILKLYSDGNEGNIFGSSRMDNKFLMTVEGFLSPRTLFYLKDGGRNKVKMRSLDPKFKSHNHVVEQRFANSKDGTMIPFFIVRPRAMPEEGAPTLMYGYGGFEIPLAPYYSSIMGKLWLERGGVYVLANIRGGGEYGPKWHRQVLKKNRRKCYEDFAAVARSLIDSGITTPEKLGISGASNGGLLVAASMVLYPDLFGAVVCSVPLLDMQRYHKLLAGASWVGEYGDPSDADMWEYIKAYSPYHNVRAGAHYPPIFIETTTKDDRVHPGHARKMAAKLKKMNHRVFYYENFEGGHLSGVTHKQWAKLDALTYSFLWRHLSHLKKLKI